ncbi:hypothetical protein CRM22_001001 [Opisthorchis felineus]|uniref:Uncharacterized protein n=1 Tax=Opisthorchis felineus TaxID=147828 RepID=A0A4S2MCJ5_OPIFE|nr:hypothetical protein CRM22_001001 [Opisthorchis felineus]
MLNVSVITLGMMTGCTVPKSQPDGRVINARSIISVVGCVLRGASRTRQNATCINWIMDGGKSSSGTPTRFLKYNSREFWYVRLGSVNGSSTLRQDCQTRIQRLDARRDKEALAE